MVYLDLWKRIFDYKGKSSLKEFWIPFVIHCALFILAFFFMISSIIASAGTGADLKFLRVAGWIVIVYLILSWIPFISLTVRRLHDAGKSGWWYFLIFAFGVGAVILLLLCGGVATYQSHRQEVSTVYGPPEWYDPAGNNPEEVYGPPEWFDTEENDPVAVYGPPEWFDTTENNPVLVYGPPEDMTEE